MANTRVKICGMTRPEDAAKAAELGADAIGLNFVGGPRMISLDRAEEIMKEIPVANTTEPMPRFDRSPIPVALCHAPSKETYGKFLWPTELGKLHINRFQIYGQDTMKLLETILVHDVNAQIWFVAQIKSHKDVVELIEMLQPGQRFNLASAIIVDAKSGDQLGGTGKTFDWSWMEEVYRDLNSDEFPNIILAGGLNPENVAEAIRIARPYAVDVSSGVEVAGKPGVKDAVKMRDFIQAVRGA